MNQRKKNVHFDYIDNNHYPVMHKKKNHHAWDTGKQQNIINQ